MLLKHLWDRDGTGGFARKLLEGGYLRLSDEGFRWNIHQELPEAPLAPLYFESRGMMCDYNLRQWAAKLVCRMIDVIRVAKSCSSASSDFEFDRYVPVPTGAVPLATTCADKDQRKLLLLPAAKGHGSGDSIYGRYDAGMHVVILEDTISTARSVLQKAVVPLRAAGLVVEEVFAIVDHGIGGEAYLRQEGLRLNTLLKMNEVWDYYLASDLVGEARGLVTLGQVARAKAYPQQLRDYLEAQQLKPRS